MIKTCRQCGSSAEHYASIPTCCKECWKARVKMKRGEKIEYYRQYDRERSSLPHRKALDKAKQRKRRAAGWPHYDAAHNAVTRAVRKGILIRPDHCTRCLIPCSPQGHHDDHSKPLEVMWLCPICHAQRHKELGKI